MKGSSRNDYRAGFGEGILRHRLKAEMSVSYIEH
jgi:hypothetical protein